METESTQKSIGLLLVEDSPDDEALVCRELLRDGFEFREFLRVENESNFRQALSNWKWDVVISDFNLPNFNGFEALRIFREQARDIPFILVSGTIGEDIAVQALKNGACDYLLKDRLRKLGATVMRELAEAQKRRLNIENEEKMRHSQKLEAIGRLAGGVAHDFNNILTVITMYCDLMTTKSKSGKPVADEVEEVRRAAEMASMLTKQLLAFSHKQILNKRPTDIGQLIRQFSKMLARLVGDNITLGTNINEPLPKCLVDTSQIESVIMNLVVNAKDAIQGGGKITIDVQKDKSADPQFADKDYVTVAVTDTGCGIDPSIQDRIFEPFFTTKGINKGTGLGLSTAFGIVKQSDGYISVQSKPGKGSTFKIYLPALPSEIPEWEEFSDPIRKNDVRSFRILLVEDQASLKSAVAAVLSGQGYSVSCLDNGADAVRFLKDKQNQFDFVITDLVMPDVDGFAVAKAAQAHSPKTKIMIMSAYLDPSNPQCRDLGKSVMFLQKPFSADTLIQKISELALIVKPPEN